MLVLYYSPPTGNSYKVRLLLSILKIPYEAIAVDIFHGGNNRTQEYLSINPLGKCPSLKLEDGSILTESNAILAYLSNGTDLFPSEKLLSARVIQWMCFEQSSHLPYIGVARFWAHLLKQEPHPEFKRLWQVRGNLALTIMEEYLQRNRWFVGDRFTIADIALYAYTHVAPDGGFDLARYPSINSWLARVEKIPGYMPLTYTHPDTPQPLSPNYKPGGDAELIEHVKAVSKK